MVCLALELIVFCVELAFGVGMEALGMRSFLVFSSFGFKPPASGFQS